MPQWLAWSILFLGFGVLALLVPLGLHRVVLLFYARRSPPESARWAGPLPRITIQLPVYNEAAVIERLLSAITALDYPADRLQVQLLDDSTDETTRLARSQIERLRPKGVRIDLLRRDHRTGFKAGALANGLERASGEFLLVLDADFLPAPDLLHRLLGPFGDPRVGMVQARWDHLNEEHSLLTRAQALLLDAHFFLEQGGRWAAGRFMSFNGTAGMWRRTALEEVGGWSSDTLTEDLDASYRAQMAGWRFVFCPEVGVSAEIPEGVRALEVQQRRWAQGGVETGRKVLPALLRGPFPRTIKAEALVHLFGHVAHPLTLLLGILFLPSALARRSLELEGLLALDLFIFLGATLSFLLFYSVAGRRRKRPWSTLLPTALLAMILGVGLTASVSGAVLRGGWGRGTEPFHRTPKRGAGAPRYRSPVQGGALGTKVALTLWMLLSIGVALQEGFHLTIPFLLLFGAGYGWLALEELRERSDALPPGALRLPDPAAGELSAVAAP